MLHIFIREKLNKETENGRTFTNVNIAVVLNSLIEGTGTKPNGRATVNPIFYGIFIFYPFSYINIH